MQLADGSRYLWLCCHPLDRPDATDRMWTQFGTSADGLQWELYGTALAGVAGRWDQRGARVTEVVRRGDRWLAYYDGRSSKEENAEERSGIAVGSAPGRLEAADGVHGAGPGGGWSLRYLSAVELPDGGTRLF